ncbi:MAG: hypothetical protein KIT73_12395 [Burkholderiales bacterium]|nr:hypothetical protein [Burkholderiales bacterium]
MKKRRSGYFEVRLQIHPDMWEFAALAARNGSAYADVEDYLNAILNTALATEMSLVEEQAQRWLSIVKGARTSQAAPRPLTGDDGDDLPL